MEGGEETRQRDAEGAAGGRAHIERGREDPPGAAAAQRDRGRHHAPQGEERERRPAHPAEDIEVHRQVSVAHQESLGEQDQRAHHRAADEGMAPARQREPPDEVIRGEEEPDEAGGHEAGEQSQEGVEDQQLALQRVAVLLRNGKGGMVAEEDVGDHRRDHARHHDRGKGAHGQGSQDLLQGEEGPRQGGVEGRRDPRRRAGADQYLGAGRVEAECIPQPGAERRSEDGDRALAPRGAAGPQRHRAGGGLGQHRLEGDPAALPRHRALHVGNVETVVLPPRALHDHPGEVESQPRQERPVGQDTLLGEIDRRGEIEDPVGEVDQPVEGDDAEASADTDRGGEAEQDGVLGECEPVEPVGEAVPHASGPAHRKAGGRARGSRRVAKSGERSHTGKIGPSQRLRKHSTNIRHDSVFPSLISPRRISSSTSRQRTSLSSMNSSASRSCRPAVRPCARNR
jgi:hypothetical protein